MDIGKDYEEQPQKHAESSTNIFDFIREIQLLAETTTTTQQISRQRSEDIEATLIRTITYHLMNKIKENVQEYGGTYEKDDPKTVCRTTVLWICIHIDSILMELNHYTIMKNWYPTLKEMNLNNSEKAEVYRLWRAIKQDIEANQCDKIPSSWSDLWTNRVIETWLKRG